MAVEVPEQHSELHRVFRHGVESAWALGRCLSKVDLMYAVLDPRIRHE